MTSLSDAIADKGLIEAKEIKKLMNSLKRKANSTTGRNFPTYRGQTTPQYVADFINQNRYKA